MAFLPMGQWALAQEAAPIPPSNVMSFGTDISSTGHLLKAKHCTIGFQVTACGINDDLLIATSPWLWDLYNMLNLVARIRIGPVTKERRQALQLGYFKTFNEDINVSLYESHYEMDMYWLTYVQTHFVTSDYTAHFNVQMMYFRDDKWPFSLRRPWLDRKPVQFNASILNEVHVYKGFYLNGDFGVLGFTQDNPEIMFGVSFEYRLESWMFRGGFAQTGTVFGYDSQVSRADYQAQLLSSRYGFTGPLDSTLAKNDYAIHPEFTIQYYF